MNARAVLVVLALTVFVISTGFASISEYPLKAAAGSSSNGIHLTDTVTCEDPSGTPKYTVHDISVSVSGAANPSVYLRGPNGGSTCYKCDGSNCKVDKLGKYEVVVGIPNKDGETEYYRTGKTVYVVKVLYGWKEAKIQYKNKKGQDNEISLGDVTPEQLKIRLRILGITLEDTAFNNCDDGACSGNASVAAWGDSGGYAAREITEYVYNASGDTPAIEVLTAEGLYGEGGGIEWDDNPCTTTKNEAVTFNIPLKNGETLSVTIYLKFSVEGAETEAISEVIVKGSDDTEYLHIYCYNEDCSDFVVKGRVFNADGQLVEKTCRTGCNLSKVAFALPGGDVNFDVLPQTIEGDKVIGQLNEKHVYSTPKADRQIPIEVGEPVPLDYGTELTVVPVPYNDQIFLPNGLKFRTADAVITWRVESPVSIGDDSKQVVTVDCKGDACVAKLENPANGKSIPATDVTLKYLIEEGLIPGASSTPHVLKLKGDYIYTDKTSREILVKFDEEARFTILGKNGSVTCYKPEEVSRIGSGDFRNGAATASTKGEYTDTGTLNCNYGTLTVESDGKIYVQYVAPEEVTVKLGGITVNGNKVTSKDIGKTLARDERNPITIQDDWYGKMVCLFLDEFKTYGRKKKILFIEYGGRDVLTGVTKACFIPVKGEKKVNDVSAEYEKLGQDINITVKYDSPEELYLCYKDEEDMEWITFGNPLPKGNYENGYDITIPTTCDPLMEKGVHFSEGKLVFPCSGGRITISVCDEIGNVLTNDSKQIDLHPAECDNDVPTVVKAQHYKWHSVTDVIAVDGRGKDGIVVLRNGGKKIAMIRFGSTFDNVNTDDSCVLSGSSGEGYVTLSAYCLAHKIYGETQYQGPYEIDYTIIARNSSGQICVKEDGYLSIKPDPKIPEDTTIYAGKTESFSIDDIGSKVRIKYQGTILTGWQNPWDVTLRTWDTMFQQYNLIITKSGYLTIEAGSGNEGRDAFVLSDKDVNIQLAKIDKDGCEIHIYKTVDGVVTLNKTVDGVVTLNIGEEDCADDVQEVYLFKYDECNPCEEGCEKYIVQATPVPANHPSKNTWTTRNIEWDSGYMCAVIRKTNNTYGVVCADLSQTVESCT